MANNQMNDQTSFEQTDMPIMCANGCGFFGTSQTMNMCSKCYREHVREDTQATSVKQAVEKSLISPSKAPKVSLVISDDKDKIKTVTSSTTPAQAGEEKPEPAPKMKNRCTSCNKKVGMLGFQCKCGSIFCGSHRYPNEHQCTYDYKEVGKMAIEIANPVIKADKLGVDYIL